MRRQGFKIDGGFTYVGLTKKVACPLFCGFTIIEVLVAIAIVSIILVIVQASYVRTTQAMRDCRERSEIYQIARFTLARMTDDISCAYIGKEELFFKGGESQLEFTSVNRGQEDGEAVGDIWTLKYYIGEEKDDRGRMKLWRQADEDSCETAEEVKAVDFYYLPPGESASNDKGWARTWDSGQTKSLPSAVRIELNLEDDDGEKGYFTTTVFIPASGE